MTALPVSSQARDIFGYLQVSNGPMTLAHQKSGAQSLRAASWKSRGSIVAFRRMRQAWRVAVIARPLHTNGRISCYNRAWRVVQARLTAVFHSEKRSTHAPHSSCPDRRACGTLVTAGPQPPRRRSIAANTRCLSSASRWRASISTAASTMTAIRSKARCRAPGLAALFDDTSGTFSASGRFSDKATRPTDFRAEYRSGKKPTLVDIRFSQRQCRQGRSTIPPLKKRGKDWVPIEPRDLKVGGRSDRRDAGRGRQPGRRLRAARQDVRRRDCAPT